MAYFSNATHGTVLEMQCAKCAIGQEACPTLGIQMLYNYDQLDKDQKKLKSAMSMLINSDGQCQTKKLIDENKNKLYLNNDLMDSFEVWADDLDIDLKKGECDILGDPYYLDKDTVNAFMAFCAGHTK